MKLEERSLQKDGKSLEIAVKGSEKDEKCLQNWSSRTIFLLQSCYIKSILSSFFHARSTWPGICGEKDEDQRKRIVFVSPFLRGFISSINSRKLIQTAIVWWYKSHSSSASSMIPLFSSSLSLRIQSQCYKYSLGSQHTVKSVRRKE